MKTLFVGNLCYTTTENQIRKHFLQVGPVHEVRLITKNKCIDGYKVVHSQGYAFVDMEDADQAIEQLAEQELDGRRLLVKLARKAKKNET